MEELLTSDLTAAGALVAIIIGFMTKRIVPWWVHEEVVARLKRYEDAAPDLIEQLEKLFDERRDEADRPARRADPRDRIRPYAALKHHNQPARRGSRRPRRTGGQDE